jgi:hypothetical protein
MLFRHHTVGQPGTGNAEITLINDTIFSNTSSDTGGGLGLILSNGGSGTNTAVLTSLTVYGNTATNHAGGVYVVATDQNAVSVDNNIFDGNTVTNPGVLEILDYSDGIALDHTNDVGYNLVGTSNLGFQAANHDIKNNNPGLQGFLADNGALPGYPQTLKLFNTSPGFEMGDQGLASKPNPLNIDAGGLIRQFGFIQGEWRFVSIGAYDPDATAT